MPQVSPHLRLTPLNPAWNWEVRRESDFQLSMKKDGWQLRVIGTASERFEQAVFEADPARYVIETGRSNQLKAIGRLQKSGVFPRILHNELAKGDAPMTTDKGLVRFYTGLVCDPRTPEHALLYITLTYPPELEGKHTAGLAEAVELMRHFEHMAPEPRPAPATAPPPLARPAPPPPRSPRHAGPARHAPGPHGRLRFGRLRGWWLLFDRGNHRARSRPQLPLPLHQSGQHPGAERRISGDPKRRHLVV